MYEQDVSLRFFGTDGVWYGNVTIYLFEIRCAQKSLLLVKIAQTVYADDRETISSGTKKFLENGKRILDF